MSHLSIRRHDHGQIDFGCDSYGGLAYRLPPRRHASPGAQATTAGRRVPLTRKKFISEHNLAWYWGRPGLFPRTQGFPIPLLETANDYSVGIRSRSMGMLAFDTDRTQCLLNRNLLAGEQSKTSDKHLSLWAVNDLSDRRTLLHYPLRYQKLNRFQRGRLLRVERVLASGDDESSGLPHCLQVPLPDEALQLRAFVSSSKERLVLVRTKKSLLLVDANSTTDEEPSISCISATPVRSFSEVPHLEDEVVAIDSAGALCWGSVDSSLSGRVVLDDELQAVVPTDCPRVFVAMSEQRLVEVDLRVPAHDNAPLQVLYSREEKLGKPACMPENVYEYHAERERFCHCVPVDVAGEAMLLSTTRRHLLIDRRMPNMALLSIGHSELNGGDYSLVTPPFQDPDTGASVYSLYSLTQTCRPSLSHWSFAYHPTERMWSSLGAKYELDSPRVSAACFAKCHGLDGQLVSGGESQLPKYTRAVHYQTLPESLASRNQVALLFRQMDGGEIWYETVLFDPLFCSEREKKAEEGGPQFEDHHLQAILTGDTATASTVTTKTTKEEEWWEGGDEPMLSDAELHREHQPQDAFDEREERLEPICQHELRVGSLDLIGRYLRERDDKTAGDQQGGRQKSTRAIYFDGVDEELIEDAKELATALDLRLDLPPTSPLQFPDEVPADAEWQPFAAVGRREEKTDDNGGERPSLEAMAVDEDVEAASASGRMLSEAVMKMRVKTLHYLHNKRKPFSARRRRGNAATGGQQGEDSGDETKTSASVDQSGSKMEEEDEEWTSGSRFF